MPGLGSDGGGGLTKLTEVADAPAAALELEVRSLLTRWGFTSVFDLGGLPGNARRLRARIEAAGVAPFDDEGRRRISTELSVPMADARGAPRRSACSRCSLGVISGQTAKSPAWSWVLSWNFLTASPSRLKSLKAMSLTPRAP
mgnify:CR=1 FL=1